MTATYDTIIVGAGSAGCVLANRLTADRRHSVLLLEAGGRDWNPLIRVPLMAGVLYTMKSVNWGYLCEPDPCMAGRAMDWPRGKVIGGSSSINGMMYARGLPSDYDDWGIDGWSYSEVLPYFLRSEAHAQRRNGFHGTDGPMAVSTAEADHPLYDAFMEAGHQAGYPRTEDFNGPKPEGFGRLDFTIRDGRRESAASAFLRPVRKRPNLHVQPHTLVRKIRIEKGRAVGVVAVRGGERMDIRARGEVVLCAGTVESPKLLMLSGIGPGETLRHHGIEVLRDLAGVGANLQDHLGAYVQHACLRPITLYHLFRPDRAAIALIQAMIWGAGPAAAMPLQAGALIRSRTTETRPDLKISIIPGLNLEASRRGQGGHGFLVNTYGLRPQSRGTVTLRSADPGDRPVIEPNYLSEPEDLRLLRDGLKLVRRLMGQSAFDSLRGDEIAPGADITTDDGLDAWLRANARTVFHPVGTCAMGEGPRAVVDASLRVRGIEGLRVADASIMPAIPSGNTHAPTVMIAEKAADLITGRPPPAPVALLKDL